MMELPPSPKLKFSLKNIYGCVLGTAGAGKTTKLIYDAISLAQQGNKVKIITYMREARNWAEEKLEIILSELNINEIEKTEIKKNISISTIDSFIVKHFGGYEIVEKILSFERKIQQLFSQEKIFLEDEILLYYSYFRNFGFDDDDIKTFVEGRNKTEYKLLQFIKFKDENKGLMFEDLRERFLWEKTIDYYDYVLLDEFQDLTPLTLSCIAKFSAKKVFYGDIDQTIYSFSGVYLPYIKKIEQSAREKYYLYKCRRVPKLIFSFAKQIRNYMEIKSDFPHLESINPLTGRIYVSSKLPQFNTLSNTAFLLPTNKKVLEYWVKIIKQQRLILVPLSQNKFKIIKYILGGRRVFLQSKDKQLKYQALLQLKKLIDKINNYLKHEKITINDILQAKVKKDCFIDTIHQSKGLEFDYVIVYDNLSSSKGFSWEDLSHLFYVATTRTKKAIQFFVTQKNNAFLSDLLFFEYKNYTIPAPLSRNMILV